MFIPKTLEDLHRIVQEQLEETTWLEFKRQLPDAGKNDDLAADLAAMANTEGGVIVYGIEQDDQGRAKQLRPVRVSEAGERVTLVAQNLDEPLTISSVFSIPCEDQEDSGFLVIEVPQSDRAPHLHKGTAWGRTAKGRTRLTRRRLGELFARSPGFAEEFGLTVGRPCRVFVRTEKEQYPIGGFGKLETRLNYFVVFVNDGDADAFDADWEWVTSQGAGGQVPSVQNNPFPLELMQPGVHVRVLVLLSFGVAGGVQVRTRWRDRNGKHHEQTWPITW